MVVFGELPSDPPHWWLEWSWPKQLAAMEQEVTGMVEGTVFPGRLTVSDEGTSDMVHLDMYRSNGMERMRISVTRDVLRIYAQRLLEAANREIPQ